MRRSFPVSSPDDAWQFLDMFAGYQRRHQVCWLYGWQSTHGQGVDLTAIHAGSVAPDGQGIPGFVKWRLILESLLTRHGTLPSTAANGGRYDSSLSREADDDDDDDDLNTRCRETTTTKGCLSDGMIQLRSSETFSC